MTSPGLWLIAPPDVPELSADIAGHCRDFRDGLGEVLGDRLASLYLFGAMAFPRPAEWRVDVDFHAWLAEPPTERQRVAVRKLHRTLADQGPLGDELDGHYLLASDAGHPAWPTCRVWGATDHAWALHRAHVLAERFMLMWGEDPRRMLHQPTWAELEASLSAEMRYIVDHPEHAAFGVLNACRVLSSVRTRNVVVSKYAAATWGIAELSDRRNLLEAAVRCYTGGDTEADRRLVAEERPDFVSSVVAETGLPRSA